MGNDRGVNNKIWVVVESERDCEFNLVGFV